MTELQDLRTVPRTPLPQPPAARTREGLEVRLLDLSLKGARIEHPDLLNPGTPCHLELPPLLGSLILSARVVWCTIIGADSTPAGERQLRAHSGLLFEELTGEQQTILTGTLQQFVARAA